MGDFSEDFGHYDFVGEEELTTECPHDVGVACVGEVEYASEVFHRGGDNSRVMMLRRYGIQR